MTLSLIRSSRVKEKILVLCYSSLSVSDLMNSLFGMCKAVNIPCSINHHQKTMTIEKCAITFHLKDADEDKLRGLRFDAIFIDELL